MDNKMKILVVTGSSGGHILPALAFLESLKKKFIGSEMLVLLPENAVINKERFSGYRVKYISIPSVRFKFNYKTFKDIIRLFKGVLSSLIILIKFKPDVAVGFGSITSVPVIIFSWFLRINTLIHEQNVLPGRANKLLGWFADKVAISFNETRTHLKDYNSKIIVTGNPLLGSLRRLDKIKALNFFGLDTGKFTILVMGGSQGSHRLNREFLKAAALLENRLSLQVIHLCGRQDFDLLNKSYKDLAVKFALFDFFDSMHFAYSACDLVLSRAGAVTVSELIFFKLPAILIPYPYANRHQYSNAGILEKKGCAVVLDEKELDASLLKDNLELFLKDNNKLKSMRLPYDDFLNFNAADLLAEELAFVKRED
ncbi:MAG: undecaprenyldiphospho-muramoylpentapeptide beta-N-acetylglucosaminyltransferase [Candidatus Omnitrophota bacterium]